MNDTDLVPSPSPTMEAGHDYAYVVPYTIARQLVLALSFVGFGLVVGMTAVVIVLTTLVTRLNCIVGKLRGDDVRGSLVQKTMTTTKRVNGTSCAEEEHEDI